MRLLGVTRALTLCGAGGIGKTRLALRILAAVADEFPDGVWFVELGDLRQPDLVVSRVASVIGVSEEPRRPLLDTLADALRPRRLLLALDNCEHLIDAAAGVCQRVLASSPGVRLIATSREPLRVAAEKVWQVPPLSVAPDDAVATAEEAHRYEAVRLFADRAAASLPGFAIGPANAGPVAALCRALDGVPLAIELAAARVRALSVEQIGARLADRFALLTRGDRTAPPRHRTLRATIDWSHELLTSKEQMLLRRLSIFAGLSLEMAEQVCSDDDIPERDILDLMTALVDKSLVVREPEVLGQARYRLLDSIRQYAAAHLADAGESATFQLRLRDYALRTGRAEPGIGMAQVRAPWSARVDVFRRYDVDAGNLWQVMSGCLAESDGETGLRICTAVCPVVDRARRVRRGRRMAGLLPGPGAARRAPARAALPVQAARTARADGADPGRPGRVGSAGPVQRSGRGQVPGRSRPGPVPVGRETSSGRRPALNLLAEVALHTGRMEEAASRADEALSVAQAAGDGWNEGYALGTRAAIAGLLGRLREASSWPRPRSPSCAASTINGERPGPSWAWVTWPGCAAIPATRTPGTWRRCPSCGRSTPGLRWRAAWPGWGGWPSTSMRPGWRGSTCPRASGSAGPPAPVSAWPGGWRRSPPWPSSSTGPSARSS